MIYNEELIRVKLSHKTQLAHSDIGQTGQWKPNNQAHTVESRVLNIMESAVGSIKA